MRARRRAHAEKLAEQALKLDANESRARKVLDKVKRKLGFVPMPRV